MLFRNQYNHQCKRSFPLGLRGFAESPCLRSEKYEEYKHWRLKMINKYLMSRRAIPKPSDRLSALALHALLVGARVWPVVLLLVLHDVFPVSVAYIPLFRKAHYPWKDFALQWTGIGRIQSKRLMRGDRCYYPESNKNNSRALVHTCHKDRIQHSMSICFLGIAVIVHPDRMERDLDAGTNYLIHYRILFFPSDYS